MNSQQQPISQPPVKKILVKRVKVLVKRPVASPVPAAAPVAAPQPTVMVKVPVKKAVAPAMTQPAPAVNPVAAPSTPAVSSSGRRSYVGQVVGGVEVKPVVFELPDDIFTAVEKYEKIPQKIMALYIYARVYAERVAQENGRRFPAMRFELPEDTMQMREILDEMDGDEMLDDILNDLSEISPFIRGFGRIISAKAPPEEIIQSELQRLQDMEITTDEQIILTYLDLLIDLSMVRKKMELKDSDDEIEQIVDDIKEMEEEENDIKKRFIEAIERKRFPVNAEKLVNNYFTLAKKDPDKAYETLITNPLFFSPIQIERLPRKLFGLIKPSAKDALAINKQLASFLKHLKV